MRQTEYMYSFREYVQLIVSEPYIDNWETMGSLTNILDASYTYLNLDCDNLPFITTSPIFAVNVRVEELFNLVKAR